MGHRVSLSGWLARQEAENLEEGAQLARPSQLFHSRGGLWFIVLELHFLYFGMPWRSGSAVALHAKGRRFEPDRRHTACGTYKRTLGGSRAGSNPAEHGLSRMDSGTTCSSPSGYGEGLECRAFLLFLFFPRPGVSAAPGDGTSAARRGSESHSTPRLLNRSSSPGDGAPVATTPWTRSVLRHPALVPLWTEAQRLAAGLDITWDCNDGNPGVSAAPGDGTSAARRGSESHSTPRLLNRSSSSTSLGSTCHGSRTILQGRQRDGPRSSA